MPEFIIDHIKNITNDTDHPVIDNAQILFQLQEGIFFLAHNMRMIEINKFNEVGRILGTMEAFSSRTNPIIGCFFDWFSIYVPNFIRTVGLIDIMYQNNWKTSDIQLNRDAIKRHCAEYVEEVIPNILLWRNKISAHPSATSPKRDDNLPTLEYSLIGILSISYTAPYYYAGDVSLGRGEETSRLIPWSLTHIFETKLVPRYWPKVSANFPQMPPPNLNSGC